MSRDIGKMESAFTCLSLLANTVPTASRRVHGVLLGALFKFTKFSSERSEV
jgi:hypothetical protein